MTLPNPLHIVPGEVEDEIPPEAGASRETGPGEGAAPAALPVPVPDAAPAVPAVRRWLSAAASSRHLGGGLDGLGAHLANPHPEPLRTHLRHAGNAIQAARDPDNGRRAASAAKAAYHLLIAVPLKLAAKTVRHGADILDWAADEPPVLILAAVILAVIAAVFLLG